MKYFHSSDVKIFKFSDIAIGLRRALSLNSEIVNPVFEAYFLIEETFCLRREKILQYFNEDLCAVSDVVFFRIFEKKIQNKCGETFIRVSFLKELLFELQKKTSQRMKNIPLAYIFKKAPFDGNIFFVSRHVLIPRFDSEVLIEKAAECFRASCVSAIGDLHKDINILDICSGSGCLGVAFSLRIISILQKAKKDNKKRLPCRINLYFADISKKALSVARKNFKNLIKSSSDIDFSRVRINAKYIKVDILNEKELKTMLDRENFFDYILYNPPYIETHIIADLSQEVQKEPFLALDGGCDGLKFYRIISRLCGYLKKGLQKRFFIEIGYNQKEFVGSICALEKLSVCFEKDIGGNFRLAIV